MAVKYAILCLLDSGPRGVARLRSEFDTATGGAWPMNIGQVYQTVRRLMRDGLVEEGGQEPDPDSGRPVGLLRITEEGREEFRHWLAEPQRTPETRRDELVMKFALAAATGWELEPLIHAQRRDVLLRLGAASREAMALPGGLDPHRLHAERRVFALEADARWLDRIESLLIAAGADDGDGESEGKGRR